MDRHYCVVLEGIILHNPKYKSDAESRFMLTGTKDVIFPITEWEVYELEFETDVPIGVQK